MHTAALAGTHTLSDNSTVDVTVMGRTAELRGADPHGEATFTLRLPVADVAALLEGTV